MKHVQFIYIHESHLDLFWLGSYQTCMERGNHIIKQFIDRCREYDDETYLLETVIFLQHFLRKNPEYKEIVQQLWRQGQLDIGCAYIDVWNNSVLGESHIRNMVEGRRWLEKELGLDVKLAVHPDLPGLAPQTPQIYAKAGVHYYSTSRKIFPYGGVWMFKAPDGSELMIFNHPTHYLFNPLEGDKISKDQTQVYDVQKILENFPLNKVLLSGGTGDLADMFNFKRRMGHDLRDILEYYRGLFPQIEFSFGTISSVLSEYEQMKDKLPYRKGEIPSIWGIDETIDFFRASRILEGKLLTAELMETIGRWNGFTSIADVREEWHGIYHDYTFFREKDRIELGEELPTLWRMHLFTQDHNGGGHEGALSEFQKRMIQDRAISYADQIIEHNMSQIVNRLPKNTRILIWNPINKRRFEPIELKVPKEWIVAGLCLKDVGGNPVPWQQCGSMIDTDGKVTIVVACLLEGVGYTTLEAGEGEQLKQRDVSLQDSENSITIDTNHLCVIINKRTGSLDTLKDKKTGIDWGSKYVNRLYAVEELKNDTTIRIDELAPVSVEEVMSVEVMEVGVLYIKIKIQKQLLHAHVEQEVTIWLEDLKLLDIQTIIWWHGQHNLQIRQCLPTADSREALHYGTPFYGNAWMNVVENSGPYMIDEITKEDYPFYREIQLWLHQTRGESALAMSTLHPTFHWGGTGLEGVLLRTPRSCGDPRFYWENSGRQEFVFRFKFGKASDSIGWANDLGQHILQTPITKVVLEENYGTLSVQEKFVELDEENLSLSSIHPSLDGAIVRFYETDGKATIAHLRIRGLQEADIISLDGKTYKTILAEDGVCKIAVGAYEIVTVSVKLYCTTEKPNIV